MTATIAQYFTLVFSKMIEARMKQAQRYIQNSRAVQELSAMTDKELADIGIHRNDIQRIIYGKEAN